MWEESIGSELHGRQLAEDHVGTKVWEPKQRNFLTDSELLTDWKKISQRCGEHVNPEGVYRGMARIRDSTCEAQTLYQIHQRKTPRGQQNHLLQGDSQEWDRFLRARERTARVLPERPRALCSQKPSCHTYSSLFSTQYSFSRLLLCSVLLFLPYTTYIPCCCLFSLYLSPGEQAGLIAGAPRPILLEGVGFF